MTGITNITHGSGAGFTYYFLLGTEITEINAYPIKTESSRSSE
ncbi:MULTISPECIES: hypothetical protein [Photorhabdus]|nr:MULTISPECIES: hypothetical protein [Photorhabdus]